MSSLNPRTSHYEFMGPPGVAVVALGLVFVIDFLYFACNANGCAFPPSGRFLLRQVRDTNLFSTSAFVIYALWVGALAVLDRVVPGTAVAGMKTRSGVQLQYKFNGTKITAILFAVLAFRAWQTNLALPELCYIYDNLLQLANATIVYALVLSTWLYVRSFTRTRGKERLLALGGNSGNALYDWFMGRELNPRIGDFDLKTFLEMRPGLLLWMVIDLAMAHHQYLKFGYVSDSMVLVCAFQCYYVIEGTFHETKIVSMMDITVDGLGFMLVFGDISLVPFTYTLQTRYLADHPVHLGVLTGAAIVAVYVAGLAIFRLSNDEKNQFKAGHESTKHLKYIEAPSGSRLLVSGWWSVARHINYTGDWLASWAYSLPCGTAVMPYYYVLFFATLLIHRELRDEEKCAEKYGDTWKEYKRRVPYRLIPGVY